MRWFPECLTQVRQQTANTANALVMLAKMEKTLAQIDDEITQLQADVASEGTTIDSAVTFIQGLSAQLQAAIAAAAAAGATPAELQALTDLDTAVTAKTQELAAAIATPAPPSC